MQLKNFFFLCVFASAFSTATSFANQRVLNIYAWTGEVPDSVVRQFEKETGIKVNLSTYENNEIMYAKVRTSQQIGYDIVMPSSYFVDRMRKQNLLEPLDKTKLPNLKNLSASFLHPTFDPDLKYSLPYIWGITGIFYNDQYFHADEVRKWSNLWQKKFNNQLLLLDDTREVFSMALLTLGYPANDVNSVHLQKADQLLQQLIPNIKVFSTDTVVSIMIDEDARVGMSWNGDAYKAMQENPHIKFCFPQDGFVIWVDNFSLLRAAPHKNAAYTFLNFMLRPDIAKQVAVFTNFPITNQAGRDLLPKAVRTNPVIYPSADVLKHGQFQVDIGDATMEQIEKYWEDFKMRG